MAAGAAGALGVVLELAGDGAAAGVGGAAGLGAAVAVLVLVYDPVTARTVNAVDLGRSEKSRISNSIVTRFLASCPMHQNQLGQIYSTAVVTLGFSINMEYQRVDNGTTLYYRLYCRNTE